MQLLGGWVRSEDWSECTGRLDCMPHMDSLVQLMVREEDVQETGNPKEGLALSLTRGCLGGRSSLREGGWGRGSLAILGGRSLRGRSWGSLLEEVFEGEVF